MPATGLMSLLPLGVLAVGLLFVLLGVLNVVRSRRRRRWPAFPGRVVASRLDGGQVQARVAYSRDGREIAFWNRHTSTTLTDPVGRDVQVLVNPDDPADAVVGGGLVGGVAVGAALIAFGLLAVAVGTTLLR